MRRDAKGRDWLMTGLTAMAVAMLLFTAGKVINIGADAAPTEVSALTVLSE